MQTIPQVHICMLILQDNMGCIIETYYIRFWLADSSRYINLTNTIIYDLPKRIQLHKPKVIVISGLLDQFYQDPYINIAEAESLVSQIVTALHKIKDVFIVLTSRFTDNQIVFPALSRIEIRAKKEFDETKLNLSIYNNGRLKKVSMMEAELTN